MRKLTRISLALASLLLIPNGAQGQEDVRQIYREKLGELKLADPEAHLALAKWLEGVGLKTEARAHLEAALSLNPDHEAVRAKLGYVKKKGRWVPAGGAENRGETARLPADVQGIADLTLSGSAWERSIAYRRLGEILKEERDWLTSSLLDPDSPGHADATDRVMPDLSPGEAEEGVIDSLVKGYVRRTLEEPLLDHFSPQRDDLISDLEKDSRKIRALLPAMKKPAVAERERMLAIWEEARQAALTIIYDTEQYYKTPADVVHGQRLVDEKVQALREVWIPLDRQIDADLGRILGASIADARKAVDRIRNREAMLSETNVFLSALGGSMADPEVTVPPGVRALLLYRAGEIAEANGLEESLTSWEKALLLRMRNRRILDANDALQKSKPPSGMAPKMVELRQSLILNRYRMMLGRQVLEVNPNLTECARGHSEEMVRLGYFAHESPIPERKTPSMRAALAGYDGSVSENIHMSGGLASAEGAHDGWYNSPPHHRNMVSESWWCMGAGHHVSHFTQNFGSLRLVDR